MRTLFRICRKHAAVVVCLILGVAAICALPQLLHRKTLGPREYSRYSPSDTVAHGVRSDIELVFKSTGVLFANEAQYLDSEAGRPLNDIRTKGHAALGPWQISGLVIAKSPSRMGIKLDIRVRVKDLEYYELRLYASHDNRAVTQRLLKSCVGGSAYWVKVFRKLRLAKRAPDLPSPRVTALPFEYPGTQAELSTFKKWLAFLLGSESMLRDGWGHRIKLELDDRESPPLLVASSAGPDGKWGTRDDLILKCNTKCGKIVGSKGFSAITSS